MYLGVSYKLDILTQPNKILTVCRIKYCSYTRVDQLITVINLRRILTRIVQSTIALSLPTIEC